MPREVLRWAIRQLGWRSGGVGSAMSMFEDASTVVRTPFGDSECFQVRVGVHQGSILSPLLFVIVMEAVTRGTRGGLPWELLYADDLVLLADSMSELSSKIKKWKDSLEKKGMKVNVGKTKWLVSGEEESLKTISKLPCGVCGKGVGSNSVQCSEC